MLEHKIEAEMSLGEDEGDVQPSLLEIPLLQVVQQI